MNKKTSLRERLMIDCAGFLVLICLSLLIRLFFLNFLLTEQNPQKDMLDGEVPQINWAELYPFPQERKQRTNTFDYETCQSKIQEMEQFFSNLTSKGLLSYIWLVQLGHDYDALIGWNITPITVYNNAAEIDDGYLTSFHRRVNQAEKVKSITEFASFCKKQNIKFVYLAAPSKLAREDKVYSGKLDFANQNEDEFLTGLKSHGILYIDLRDNIEQEGLNQKSLFFKTDHHWLPETALWAASEITKELDTQNVFHGNPALLEADRFEHVVYPNIYLGSHGKKVTLARTKPEDITKLLPLFPTQFHLYIPSLGLDQRGDFSIFYDQSKLQYGDLYQTAGAYHAYLYGEQPYISIENEQIKGNSHILMIRDSFGDTLAPFLTLEVQHLDLLDLRYFTGSVQSFVKQHHPDVVLVLYSNAEYTSPIDWKEHKDPFDFR